MHPPPLAVMDYVGPALGALLFVGVMSTVAEPTRRTLNAIILAGASGVYLSGGFGLWELAYPVIGAAIGFRALQSIRWIGVGWLIHACLGHRASPVGQSHLAVHAEFRVWLHDLRQHDCAVVPRRCAIVSEALPRRDARRRCVNDA